MIKAIIWDMGGVLIEEKNLTVDDTQIPQIGLSIAELAQMVFYHPLTPKLFVGEERPEKLWKVIGDELNISNDEAQKLGADFWGEPIWNYDLLGYITSLKGKYKLGVLSDAWITTRKSVQEEIHDNLFDAIMFSAEEGLRKPDPKLFQSMLSRLEVTAEEAIFVDDRINNVQGAEQVSIHGIHYTPEINIQEQINQITSNPKTENRSPK